MNELILQSNPSCGELLHRCIVVGIILINLPGRYKEMFPSVEMTACINAAEILRRLRMTY